MTRFIRDQDGSIPMMLTVVILVGGVVAALFSTVIGTQRTVNFDRAYTEAITNADAGLQQAVMFLSQLDRTDPRPVIESTDLPADAGATLGSGTFSWSATKVGPLRWDVRAAGSVNGETRFVEATIAANSDFFIAAFADQGITLRGGNGAVSYPAQGYGAIGSNNAVTMNGNSYADSVFLYGSSSSCTGTGCSTASVDGFSDQLDMDAVRTTVQDKHDALCSTYSAWTASEYDDDNDGVVHLAGGDVICASQLLIDADIVIDGADQDNPVQWLVTGDLAADNSLEINCPGCNLDSQPASGALQIYSLGATVGVGNHSYIAMAMLAPNAGCAGTNSNAQTHLFGSLICRSIGNQGGWVFHFDENLLGIGAGGLDILTYREEALGTTSF